MNLDDLEPMELELLFKFKISTSQVFDDCADDNVQKIICQSKNSKFLAFNYQEVLYIIQDQIKTILYFQQIISNCCFSEDSKYCAIFLHDKYKLLMLFDLEEKKMVFTKKIGFLKKFYVQQKLNFYQNSIIMTSAYTIESFSLQGEEKFQLKYDRNYNNIHIKLNEKFLIISQSSIKDQVNKKHELIVFSAQSFKNLKRFAFCQNYERPFMFSQNLLFFMPLRSKILLVLREITTNKLIRKYQYSSPSYILPLYLKEILNNEIIGYEISSQYKFDISKGTVQKYPKEFPMPSLMIRIAASQGMPLFIEDQIEKKVWKKNHFKKLVELVFYKIKV